MDKKHHEQVVLIIDDEQTNLNVIIDTLASAGLTHITARNGEMGIKRATFAKPDLILLDVMMPGIDGFETCRRLKADPVTREIPVLFMTALQDVNSKIKGFEAGGVDYITKPIEELEILARIKNHLALRHAQQELQIKNEQLHRSEQFLREANDTKNTFFSIMAHDLRTPFNGLLGLTEILIDSIDTLSRDDIVDFSNEIKQSAEAVYNLLENLLNWSRFQRNIMKFQPQEFQFFPFITKICKLYQAQSEQKNINIYLKGPQDITVYADMDMLGTMIRNLISNALKFTSDGGSVTLSAKQQDNQFFIKIEDTGIGIPEEILPNLFRIDKKTTTTGTLDETGSGLGLPLCKDLVEKHDGTIQVSSIEGKGSTFVLTLPSMPNSVLS
jgi:signal transduction histidine kinase